MGRPWSNMDLWLSENVHLSWWSALFITELLGCVVPKFTWFSGQHSLVITSFLLWIISLFLSRKKGASFCPGDFIQTIFSRKDPYPQSRPQCWVTSSIFSGKEGVSHKVCWIFSHQPRIFLIAGTRNLPHCSIINISGLCLQFLAQRSWNPQISWVLSPSLGTRRESLSTTSEFMLMRWQGGVPWQL